MLQAIFYVFSGLTILSALFVVLQNNPVRCVLFLVMTFLCSSVLWILVNAEFLALILVLVYVGAVMTLFLFVVMMLNIDVEAVKKRLYHHLSYGLLLGSLLIALLLKALPNNFKSVANQLATSVSDTEALGMVLYTDYALPVELAALILLVAIIASITLVHRRPKRSKQQNVVKQIRTRREDRIELIDLKITD